MVLEVLGHLLLQPEACKLRPIGSTEWGRKEPGTQEPTSKHSTLTKEMYREAAYQPEESGKGGKPEEDKGVGAKEGI